VDIFKLPCTLYDHESYLEVREMKYVELNYCGL